MAFLVPLLLFIAVIVVPGLIMLAITLEERSWVRREQREAELAPCMREVEEWLKDNP